MLTLEKLVELGFQPHMAGIHYIHDAVKMKHENTFIKMGTIYTDLGKKYNKTPGAIERCIRHCIHKSSYKYNKEDNSFVIAELEISLLGGDKK